MPGRREVILAGVLAAGGAVGIALGPAGRHSFDKASAPLEPLLPKNVDGWAGRRTLEAVLPPEDGLTEQTYGEVVIRRFVNGNQLPVTLVIARDAAHGFSTQLHRPEVCYPASGFTITSRSAQSFTVRDRTIPAAYLEAKRGNRRDAVLYWSHLDGKFPKSVWAQRAIVMRHALSGDVPPGVLVRLSRPATTATADMAALAQFARHLLLNCPAPLQESLIGSSI